MLKEIFFKFFKYRTRTEISADRKLWANENIYNLGGDLSGEKC